MGEALLSRTYALRGRDYDKGGEASTEIKTNWSAHCRPSKKMRRPAMSLNIKEGDPMLWTIAVILIVLWLLGLVTGYTMGNFIHILLVIAIVVVLVRVIQGRRPI